MSRPPRSLTFALCWAPSLRRDLLIVYRHQINDRFEQLSAQHLTALATQLKLAQTQIHEVTNVHHHFEVVKEGPDGHPPAAAALTVRVSDRHVVSSIRLPRPTGRLHCKNFVTSIGSILIDQLCRVE